MALEACFSSLTDLWDGFYLFIYLFWAWGRGVVGLVAFAQSLLLSLLLLAILISTTPNEVIFRMHYYVCCFMLSPYFSLSSKI